MVYKVGDTVRATATVESDINTYTLGTTKINGITAGNLQKFNDTTYTFDYIVQEGNTDRIAGTIPVSLMLVDQVGQYNDPASTTVQINIASIDAHTPVISDITFLPSSGILKIGDTATATIYSDGNGYASGTITINGKDVATTFCGRRPGIIIP